MNKNQRGFTLIELMIAIAIAGVITGATTITIFQVIDGSTHTSNHMTAVRQVQNAGYWVSHDTQMAQDVDTGNDPLGTGFPLILTWTEWDSSDEYWIVYRIVDNSLRRDEYINREPDGDPDGTLVFEYIINTDPDTGELKTYCEFPDGVLVFTVTATVQEQSETRVYEILPRPSS
ncbi:MAG: type II secretion system protein [Dehalococcoidales bacterium]|nr:type II secretion system protein [Dehalococcoidales bacterium]